MTIKVLVLGANGFIGARLVRKLLASGYSVRILTRKDTTADKKNVSVFRGDLTNPDLDVDALVEGCSIVFNCAGEIKTPALMQALHVDSCARLLAAFARVTLPTTKRWVQLSSVGAYGPSRHDRIVTEETATQPVGPYEVTKTLADELVTRVCLAEGLEFSILRPSNVFAHDMPNNSLRQLAGFVKRGMYLQIGSNRSYATYVHADDVVDALIACGVHEKANGQIFNISNDCYLDEMISGMAKALNVAPPKKVVPEWLIRTAVSLGKLIPGFPVSSARIDALTIKTRYPTTKMRSLLGIEPCRNVPEYAKELV